MKAGERGWIQVLDGKSGYFSQSLKPLYFGLGEAAAVDKVQVQWPLGKVQTVAAPAIDCLLEITEPPKD